MKTLYFAGGCFWGVQKFFDQFDAVLETEVGYANGPEERDEKIYGPLEPEQRLYSNIPPGYQEVCNDTGFAETVKVVYDEEKLSTEKLLGFFFLIIDPLAVNRQGPDVGVQYRTGIYYEDESLLPIIEEAVKAVEESVHQSPLATEVEPLFNYYKAEEANQKYLDKTPYGYCHIGQAMFRIQKQMDKARAESEQADEKDSNED